MYWSLPFVYLAAMYYGNVLIGGRPVCDDRWDGNDAKVACRELKFGQNTKAIATGRSAFGNVGTNFRVDEVSCLGGEARLHTCKYQTRNDCGGGEGAGVYCIDPDRMVLKGGSNREGNVFIGEFPVCDQDWNIDDAQVVCSSLLGSKFTEREGVVPVFEATKNSAFGNANTNTFIMYSVNCKGNELRLTDCTFEHKKTQSKCNKGNVAGVKCAKCTIADLKAILGSIKVGATFDGSRQSIRAAFERLKASCLPWDCTKTKPGYKEYCMAYAFLQDATYLVQTDSSLQKQVSLKFDAGKLLSHDFTKQESNRLLQRIDSLQGQTESFQKQLASYYDTMAKFDREKARADYTYASTLWVGQRQGVSKLQDKIGPEMSAIFELAFAAQGAELAYRASQLALAIASLIQPANAVFNPGATAATASKIADQTSMLLDSTAGMVELGYTFDTTLPKFKILASTVNANIASNKAVYDNIAEVVGIENLDAFTEDKAKEFLDAYSKYKPAITAGILSRYHVLIDQMVDNACGTLTKPGGGAIKAAIRMTATCLCPETKQDVKVLKDLLTAYKGMERIVLDTFADFARAKVSEIASKELSKVVGRSSADVIEGVITKKKAQVLFQMHKTVLINSACDTIKYMYYGEDQDFCIQLRGNTFGDLGKLVSFKYDADLQCADRNSKKGIFNLPAMVRRGSEEVPSGTLDLTPLLNPANHVNSVPFQIPNAKWLVDNRWISSYQANNGPFFLKRFQLSPLPTMSTKMLNVNTELSLVSNVLENDQYTFDEKVSAYYSYEEKNHLCEESSKAINPYSVRNCPVIPKTCTLSKGDFYGKIYPSLLSLWEVIFYIPPGQKKWIPFPVGPFNLKVKAEICFRQSMSGRDVEIEEKQAGQCCSASNQYSDLGGNCLDCPANSVPRLNGYYCESCPAGHAPRDGGVSTYGCRPCPVDKFKAGEGMAACQACVGGTNTNGTEGASECAPTVASIYPLK